MRSSVMSVTRLRRRVEAAAARRSLTLPREGHGGDRRRHAQSQFRSVHHDASLVAAISPSTATDGVARESRGRRRGPARPPGRRRPRRDPFGPASPWRSSRPTTCSRARSARRTRSGPPSPAAVPDARPVDAGLRLPGRSRADDVAAVVDGARQVHALRDGADVRELRLIGRTLAGRSRTVIAACAMSLRMRVTRTVASGQPGEERVDVVVAHFFGALVAGVAGAGPRVGRSDGKIVLRGVDGSTPKPGRCRSTGRRSGSRS